MPTTYNGIGTHYYGKKNLQKRTADCPHCGNHVELSSYDTRLWFVVIFIPIIPLGRKRIIDSCPRCTRHYAIEADKWETMKQLEVSGAVDKFRTSQTPEDAIALHQQLINFHQMEKAAEFRRSMREKFPDNAKIHAYLGAALEHLGELDEAGKSYKRALEIRPDMPEARIGAAQVHIRASQVDDARKLLDFLEKAGAGQLYPMEPLNQLAQAFQRVNRHEDALALFSVLQRELPNLTDLKWFRDFVQKSEKALNKQESLLPKQKFSWKRFLGLSNPAPATTAQAPLTWKSLLVGGIVIALILFGFVISNEYIRRHRTLYIANGFGQPVSVSIKGVDGPLKVASLGEVKLSEGCYHASITGPVNEEIDFEVRTDYFGRWWNDPVWMLNPGGRAILVQTEAIYRESPIPPNISIHYGKKFERFPHVTHPFRALPDSVQLERGGSKTLVNLDLFRGRGFDVVSFYVSKGNTAEALNFAESWLATDPDDEDTLRLYAVQAATSKKTQRLDTCLRKGLTNRPVRVEWHRTYQQMHSKAAEHAALVAEYQKLLEAEPDNSALLYLRGRLEQGRTKSLDYFTRSQRADPSNPYPTYALAYAEMSSGNWAEARKHLARTVELRPESEAYRNTLAIARFATGEITQVEQELRERVKAAPTEYQINQLLVDVLARENKREDVDAVCKAFRQKCTSQYGKEAAAVVQTLECHALYALGDFARLEKEAGTLKHFSFEALIEQGRVEEALKFLEKQEDADAKPVVSMAISLAFRNAGNREQADRWLELAREALSGGNEEHVAAAQLLQRPPAQLTMSDVDDVVLPNQVKAILVAHLAQLDSPVRSELVSLARRLHVQNSFPFHLIQRVTGPRS